MIERQRVLARFGEFAIRSENLQEVLTESCRLIADALGVHLAKVLEIQPDRKDALVRAGVGWRPGIVGNVRVPLNEESSEAFAIERGSPVVCSDIGTEERFALPPFLREHGVRALVDVPIFVPGRKPYGILEVDAREPRDFGEEDTEFLRTYATILGPVIDRLHKIGAAKRQKERLRLVAQNALDYAILIIDDQGKVTDWLPGAEAIFGWTADEIVGRDASALATPADAGKWPGDEMTIARRDGFAPDNRWHRRKDGSRVFLDGSMVPLADGDGGAGGFLKIEQDVTERRRVSETLRESENRFRQFGDASASVLWIRNAETLRMEYVNSAFAVTYGVPQRPVIEDGELQSWISLILPEDREATFARIDRVLKGETVAQDFRIRRPSDQEVRWLRGTSFPLINENGKVERIGGITEDFTEAKAMADRMGVLVAELQHCTRNLLGVVSSVSRRTLAESDTLGQFRDGFSDRLGALSRVNGLLSRIGNETDRVTFDELLETELHALGAFEGGKPIEKVTLDGPSGVKLRSSTVQTFALALHELATNAARYGALAQSAGRLSVRWRIEDGADGMRKLHVEWQESGITLPEAPRVHGGGYGRELIEQALPYQLGAETSLTIGDDGVLCTIRLRVSSPEYQ